MEHFTLLPNFVGSLTMIIKGIFTTIEIADNPDEYIIKPIELCGEEE